MRPCLLIPIYDHGDEIPAVLEALEPLGLHCIVVDDGSHPATRAVLDALEERHAWIEVHHRKENGGRGAALKTGYRLAAQRGFSHAVQLDADGQHDASDVPLFLREIEEEPEALVLGSPVFDESAPRLRLYGRQLSRGMVWLTTLSFDANDPLCGFRGIPLASALALIDSVPMGDAMEFDPELVIRLHWRGTPIRNVRTRVVYRPEALSHFEPLGDSLRMARVYTRSLARLPAVLASRLRGAAPRDRGSAA